MFINKTNTEEARFSGSKLSYVSTISTSGDTIAITPTTGKSIRVFWVSFVPNPDNTSAVLVKIGFGTTTISTEIYRGYAMAHWEVFTGSINEQLIINTSLSQSVAFTIHYQEV